MIKFHCTLYVTCKDSFFVFFVFILLMGFIVLGTIVAFSLILFYNGINHGMLLFRIYSEIVMLLIGIVIVIVIELHAYLVDSYGILTAGIIARYDKF